MFKTFRKRRAARAAARRATEAAHRERQLIARETLAGEARAAAREHWAEVKNESRANRQMRLSLWISTLLESSADHEVPVLWHCREDELLERQLFHRALDRDVTPLVFATTGTHLLAIYVRRRDGFYGTNTAHIGMRVALREQRRQWSHAATFSVGLPERPAIIYQLPSESVSDVYEVLEVAPDHPAGRALWAAGLFATTVWDSWNSAECYWHPVNRLPLSTIAQMFRDPPLVIVGGDLSARPQRWAPNNDLRAVGANSELSANPNAVVPRDSSITPRAAEEAAAAWMRDHGWRGAATTSYTNDSGIDVWASASGTRPAAAAQVKFERQRTGRPALQNLFGAGHGRAAGAWLFFSRGDYTQAARAWAHENGMALFIIDDSGAITATNNHAQRL